MAGKLRVLFLALLFLGGTAIAPAAAAAQPLSSPVPTMSQLTALEMRIASQGPAWRAAGVHLAEWAADPVTHKVVIALSSYSAAAARKLVDRYGATWVSVSTAPDRQQFELADRFSDRSPFRAGDAIFFNSHTPGTVCTSGIAVSGKGGKDSILTAGHCVSRPAWFTNHLKVQRLGATTANFVPDGIDAQTISGEKYQGLIWGNGNTTFSVVGTFTATKNDKIAFSGARTGLVLNVNVITRLPFCAEIGNLDLCGLMQASDAKRVICIPGDSGGPVFKRVGSGNHADAVGIITATADGGHLCVYTEIGIIDTVLHVAPLKGP
jgi:hypothetical protein